VIVGGKHFPTYYHVGFFLGLFFYPEDGGDMYLRNITTVVRTSNPTTISELYLKINRLKTEGKAEIMEGVVATLESVNQTRRRHTSEVNNFNRSTLPPSEPGISYQKKQVCDSLNKCPSEKFVALYRMIH
jgi:hypothetical protein